MPQGMTPRILKLAKAMRRKPTDAESALWRHLRAGRLLGFKFKRQETLGTFIVDFVCFDFRLIVEVDGSQHSNERDAGRTWWLEQQGFRVLRFWNDEVLTREKDVLEAILSALRKSPPLPHPSLARGEGLQPKQSATSARESRDGQRLHPSPLTGEGQGRG